MPTDIGFNVDDNGRLYHKGRMKVYWSDKNVLRLNFQTYTFSPGTHVIYVLRDGKIIYQKPTKRGAYVNHTVKLTGYQSNGAVEIKVLCGLQLCNEDRIYSAKIISLDYLPQKGIPGNLSLTILLFTLIATILYFFFRPKRI